MARLRGSHPSPTSKGATLLAQHRAQRSPEWLAACATLGETSVRGHQRGAVMPGAEALDLYHQALGLLPGDFVDPETRRRHRRIAERLAAGRAA